MLTIWSVFWRNSAPNRRYSQSGSGIESRLPRERFSHLAPLHNCVSSEAVYRQADAAARSQRAQSRPRSVEARASRDTAAPAVDPAGPAHTGMRAHPRARHPTRRSGPMDRAWCLTTAGITSPRPRPSATDSSHTGRPGQARSRRSDPTRPAGPPRPPDRPPAAPRRGSDARGSAGPPPP